MDTYDHLADNFEQLDLFRDVQLQKVFPDGKTFVDCVPMKPLAELNTEYLLQKDQPGFSIAAFVARWFTLPVPMQQSYVLKQGSTVQEHIEALWDVLVRPSVAAAGSRIALHHPFVVPGGRFGEMYYWDTFFTMLGLQVSGRKPVLAGIVANFAALIDTYGYIPNGTRTYFLGRSQPPYFSMMVSLLADESGDEIYQQYLPQLETEYRFWMKGMDAIDDAEDASMHVVRLPGGEYLNRYCDEHDTPRPESYREDIELGKAAKDPVALFKHLRAGAESGWDYSSRWFTEPEQLETIHTNDILPVDLNCLLWNLESVIAKAHEIGGSTEPGATYRKLAEKRAAAIRRYCWDSKRQFYFDYDYINCSFTPHYTLAAATPLFFNLASQDEGEAVAEVLKDQFLRDGGLVTTLKVTGQQWDAPNGWAPLQWIAVIGLENYGLSELAGIIARRWIAVNTKVFERTGKLMEKYNVVDVDLAAGGGEYLGQDGFGWTNGVLMGLIKRYGG